MATVSVLEVDQFVSRFNAMYGGRLQNFYNYSRVVSLAWLNKCLEGAEGREYEHAGVISGSSDEPELKLIRYKGIELLNFEADTRFDLDVDWSAQPSRNFSFTLCNQVLEHVFHPHQAFRNLVHHTRPRGLIFVSLPTINCVHGEPHFYSSGFHPRFLRRLAEESGLEVLGTGEWGTLKYMLHAVTGTWLTDESLRPGFHGPHDFRFPNLVYADGRNPDDPFTRSMQLPPFITDCWGLFRRP
jgi:hypothetical protein